MTPHPLIESKDAVRPCRCGCRCEGSSHSTSRPAQLRPQLHGPSEATGVLCAPKRHRRVSHTLISLCAQLAKWTTPRDGSLESHVLPECTHGGQRVSSAHTYYVEWRTRVRFLGSFTQRQPPCMLSLRLASIAAQRVALAAHTRDAVVVAHVRVWFLCMLTAHMRASPSNPFSFTGHSQSTEFPNVLVRMCPLAHEVLSILTGHLGVTAMLCLFHRAICPFLLCTMGGRAHAMHTIRPV